MICVHSNSRINLIYVKSFGPKKCTTTFPFQAIKKFAQPESSLYFLFSFFWLQKKIPPISCQIYLLLYHTGKIAAQGVENSLLLQKGQIPVLECWSQPELVCPWRGQICVGGEDLSAGNLYTSHPITSLYCKAQGKSWIYSIIQKSKKMEWISLVVICVRQHWSVWTIGEHLLNTGNPPASQTS